MFRNALTLGVWARRALALGIVALPALVGLGCARNTPFTPGGGLQLALSFPSSADRRAPRTGTAAASIDTLAITVSDLGKTGAPALLRQNVPISAGSIELEVVIDVPPAARYGIRVDAIGQRQRSGQSAPTTAGIQFRGEIEVDALAAQAGPIMIQMIDVVPLPALFQKSSGIDSVSWAPIPGAVSYTVRESAYSVLEGNISELYFRYYSEHGANAYQVRVALPGGAESAFSEPVGPAMPWRTGTSMPTSRDEMAVGVLDSRIYVVGGSDGGPFYLPRADVYDPIAGTWAQVANMPTPRGNLAAGVIGDTLYAVGGYGATQLPSLEGYVGATNTWVTRAAMPTARNGLGVGVIRGVLYAVGGSGGGRTLGTMEAYDPRTNTWSPRPPMPTPRKFLAVGVVNDILYAVGGTDSLGVALRTVEAYDPVSNQWSARPPMAQARANHAASVIGSVLYVVGGRSGALRRSGVEAYDQMTGTWTTKTSMPTARFDLGAAALNSRLFAVGGLGRDPNLTFDSELTIVEEYDPALDPRVAGAAPFRNRQPIVAGPGVPPRTARRR